VVLENLLKDHVPPFFSCPVCRDPHAWPEVYLPGGGWRGYGPSHGSAVANAHVSVAAACSAADAAPIEGSFYGPGASSSLEYTLDIRTHDRTDASRCKRV
jgi:transglutaminase-like putative cysteine protease